MKRAKPGTTFVERALGRLAAPPGRSGIEPPPRRYAAIPTPVFKLCSQEASQ